MVNVSGFQKSGIQIPIVQCGYEYRTSLDFQWSVSNVSDFGQPFKGLSTVWASENQTYMSGIRITTVCFLIKHVEVQRMLAIWVL